MPGCSSCSSAHQPWCSPWPSGGCVIRLRDARQRRDVALMRLRGATPQQIAVTVGAVALSDALVGAVLGVAGAAMTLRLSLGRGVGLGRSWVVLAVVCGVLVSLCAQLVPVIAQQRPRPPMPSSPAPSRLPWPLRGGLDLLLLAGSGLVFWLTSRGGYQVVVAPEGVPVVSVNYAALLAPALAWLGAGAAHVAPGLGGHGVVVAAAGRTRTGRLGDLRRHTARRRRRLIARAATGLAAAVAVTTAAAVFTTTYDRQAHADVALTVGSDVAVTPAGRQPGDPRPAAREGPRGPGRRVDVPPARVRRL